MTPAETAEYQRLGTQLGFLNAPAPVTAEAPDGFLGFAAKHAANILPSAFEKIIQPAQTLMGFADKDISEIPRFFDIRPPQGLGEKLVAGGAELASYLPALIGTEGLAAGSLAELGMSARAAKIAGSALGFGLPMAPHGAEEVGIQGGVGALQTAAMDWGWRGKLAAGAIGAAAGYYEGQKESPEAGLMMGALNLAGPTLIDPALHHIFGIKKAGAAAGKESEAVPPPNQPTGAGQGTSSTPGMPAGIMGGAFEQMNEAQRRAYLDALMGRSEPPPAVFGPETARSGIFGDRQMSGTFGEPPPDIGGGRPIAGQPVPGPAGPEAAGLLTPQFTYGRGTNPYDVFAGVQPRGVRTIMPAVTNGIDFTGSDFIYGRGTSPYDIAAGLERAPTFGPEPIFSPREAAARAAYKPPEPVPTPVAAPPKAKAAKKAKPVASLQVTKASGEAADLKPRREGPHVISTAVMDNDTGKYVVGESWRDMHRVVKSQDPTGVMSTKFDEPGKAGEAEHVFVVQDEKGKVRVVNREEAGRIADLAGQRDPEYKGYPLQSEHLNEDVVPPKPKPVEPAAPVAPAPKVKHSEYSVHGAGSEGDGTSSVASLQMRREVSDVTSELARVRNAGGNVLEIRAAEQKVDRLFPKVIAQVIRDITSANAARSYAGQSRIFGYTPGHLLEYLDNMIPGHFPFLEKQVTRKSVLGEGKTYQISPSKSDRMGRLAAALEREIKKADSPLEAILTSGQRHSEVRGYMLKEGEEKLIREWARNVGSKYYTDFKGFYEAHTVKPEPPAAPPVASLQVTAPSQTPTPPASEIRVRGKHGLEIANIVGETADSYDIVIDDPIFGERKATILKSEALPAAAPAKPPVKGGTVPFQDVPGAKNILDKGEKYGGEGGLLGAAEEPSGYTREDTQKRIDSIQDRTLWKETKAYNEAMQIEADYGGGSQYTQEDVLKYTNNFMDAGGAGSLGRGTTLASLQENLLHKKAQLMLYKLMADEGLGHQGYRNYWEQAGDHVQQMHKNGENIKKWMKENAQYLPKREIPPGVSQGDIPSSYELKYGKQGEMLGTVLPGSGPTKIVKTLPGRERLTLSVVEGLKRLNPEAAHIIGEIFHRIQVAAGQEIDLSLATKMPGAKGGMYELSGRIALNLQWINQIVGHWDKMSGESQAAALMRIAALFGHEVTHVAQKYGERSHLAINGKPLLNAIMEQVDSMNLQQRKYVIEQIQKAKGDPAKVVSRYLSGDIDYVHAYYKRLRPGLTRDQAVELAAGEFMAEVGAVELMKRMKVDGLPDAFRSMVDTFKNVIVRVIAWFKGEGDASGVAAMQSLSDIANKMYDHLAVADATGLHGAFPASAKWPGAPKVNPFTSVTPPPIGPSLTEQPYAKMELARIGARAAVGGTLGGMFGPTVTDHKLTMAESVIAGGVLGAFGPMLAKSILKGNIATEVASAVKRGKGNPVATLQALMGGKTLRELGAEARYGWRGDGSTFAKIVRFFESEWNLHLDPKIKSIIEQARGIMGEQFALIEDALKKSRWSKVSQGVKDATTEYIEGRIDKSQYLALLTDDPAKLFGNFMIAAREGTSVATDMLAAGMREGKFKKFIIENREKYVGRFYEAYKKGEFDMTYFDKVVKDLMDANLGMDIHNAEALLREHMIEIKANRSLFGTKRGTGAQAIESKTQFRRLATEEEIYMQQLEVAGLEHDPFSPEYAAAYAKLKWMEQNKITDNWRGWLGEIKDPVQRMIYTFEKVYPSSIAGKIFDLFDNTLDSLGNKFAYSGSELTNMRALIKAEMSAAGKTAEEVASLQKRLDVLEAYTPLPQGSAYGKLSGKFTDRFVRDQISTYDTPYKWMDQPFLRGIAAINSVVKINRTVLNPLTMIRNYLQMPLFMLIARTTPDEIFQAAKIIHKGADPELLSIMRQRHIIGVDYAAQELTTNLGNLVSGYFDSDAAVRIARLGYDTARKTYEQPDMLQRAGAFLSARKRYAERLGLDLNHPDVINAAVEATERVTMNYATVPRMVKAGRQLPFVSLFVSYTSEMTKILKNLASDAIGKDVHAADRWHAIGMLGAMAAVPPLLVATFEGALSEKDKKDWQTLRKLQPDYARSRFYLPLGREKDGRFRYMDITNMIPADNYTQMMKSASEGDMEGALAANPFFSLQDTPLLNIATEQISGTDLRTGNQVKGGYDRVKEILKEILPPIVPPGYEGQRMIRAFSENKEGGFGLTNLRTGVETRPSDIIANYLTGMRFANMTLATVQKTAIANAQQAIAHEQQLLRDTVNTNVADEAKIEARNRYRHSVEQIMLQLHSRMGTQP